MAARCDGGAAGEGNQRHGPLTDMTALDSPDDYFMRGRSLAIKKEKKKEREKEKVKKEGTGKIEGKRTEEKETILAVGKDQSNDKTFSSGATTREERSGYFLKETQSPNRTSRE